MKNFFVFLLFFATANAFDFLGFEVNSPFGLAPCPASLSEGITVYARNGCDILTYKTIRSQPTDIHPTPNIFNVYAPNQLEPTDFFSSILTIKESTQNRTWANSYGIGCAPLEQVEQDIKKAKRALHPGQVLIVSIYGQQSENKTLMQDFVDLALFAKQAGADIIEANLSCPNLIGTTQFLYQDSGRVLELCSALSAALGATPLLLKIGFVPKDEALTELLTTADQGGAQGIVSMNSFPMHVFEPITKTAAFGPLRTQCGISGNAIRNLALAQIERITRITRDNNLNLVTIGAGGVMNAAHVRQFLKAGALAVLSATGLMANPELGNTVAERLKT